MSANTPRDKKALLREWRTQRRAKARALFPLDDASLCRFFDRLDELLDQKPCAHGLVLARAVMDEMGLSEEDAEALFDWCEDHGGYCDCEISANTRQHWESSREAS